MFIVTNITDQIQQIHLCDGSGVSIAPKEEVEVNFNLLFPEEQIRIRKFFMVEPLEKETIRIVRENYTTDNLKIVRSSVNLEDN
jgi:hypothetical protein